VFGRTRLGCSSQRAKNQEKRRSKDWSLDAKKKARPHRPKLMHPITRNGDVKPPLQADHHTKAEDKELEQMGRL